MIQQIKFGTDGWRAVIADDFTFENLERVALATARYYKNHKKIRNGLVVGYDARFMSREFAEKAAEVIANAGVRVSLADSIVTTPMVSLLTKLDNAAGGVVITASHNPPQYNGFKIKGDFGGPAHPEMIAQVEKRLAAVMKLKRVPKGKLSFDELVRKGKIRMIGMKQRYLEDLGGKVAIPVIRDSGIRILYDVMYGAGQGVLTTVLPGVRHIHEIYNPSFGGTNPEPIAQNLGQLMHWVKTENYQIGLATDGDADRIGAVDENGEFVDSHRIFSILLKYFVQQKKMTGEVVKTISVTSMVDKQCKKYGLTMHETPVGFKHVCRLMTERDIIIGGEESGGLGTKAHLPERDGIYLGLMLCEVMAARQKSLSGLVEELMDEFGPHEFKRIDLHVTDKVKTAIMNKFRKGVREIAGSRVIDRKDIDGHKLFTRNGWVLVRASGTEPLVRFYAEADSMERVDALLEDATRH